MSLSNNHQSKSPRKKEALYDEFLKKFPENDGASSQHDCIHSSYDRIKSFRGSTDKSNTGDGGGSEGNPDVSLKRTPEQKQKFLEKIYQRVTRANIHGFDYDEKSLKMMLLKEGSQDSFQLIGVVGKLGVGKTALCRLILDEEEVKQRFVPRLLIPLSESEFKEPRSMENVVKKMLEHLGVEEGIINISEDHKLPGLLYALHLQLKGKKFLIVLDDVQEQDDYYKNLISCLSDGHGFPKGSGGAVILTSRNENAIKWIVGEQNLHRLLPISDPESCWRIYQTLALGDDGIHQYPRPDAPKEVQEELRKKCGGFPLVARIMGELKRREPKEQVGSKQPDENSRNESKDDSTQAATASTELGLQSKPEIIDQTGSTTEA